MTTIDSAIENVTVVGAAGKMGRGIALLLLQECALRKSPFLLKLIDMNDALIKTLPPYLEHHLKRYAERNISTLRTLYANDPTLISDEKIINTFLMNAMQSIRYGISLEEAKGSHLIFEAILEDIPTKVELFKKINSFVSKDCFFFTNTSSIPINLLNTKAGLNGRLIGFHFYNPPAVQKLIEIIAPKEMNAELLPLATDLAERLHKTVVFSADVAGFIGNGHFIPELHYACTVATKLAKERPLYEALYIVNEVTQNFLIRPMGIFQLADYVGLDVCQRIAEVMDPSLVHPLLSLFLREGRRGGQYPDGAQRPGIFDYSRGHLTALYDPTSKTVLPLSQGEWVERCRTFIGPLPEGHASWKELQKSDSLSSILRPYFSRLFLSDTSGCTLAKHYLIHSEMIAKMLVDKGVAENLDAVETVLKLGFYHLYTQSDLG